MNFLHHAQGEAATAKTGETFSTDSAVWYLEAALNFSFGDVAKFCQHLTSDSLYVPFPCGEDSVQATTVYELFNSLEALIAPMTTEEQHVSLVDVVEPVAGSSELLVMVRIGSGYEKGAPNTTYGPKDYVYYGRNVQPAYDCGCEPPPQLPRFGYCADKIIEQRINQANLIALGVNQYITDVETWSITETDYIPFKWLALYRPNLLGPAPLGDGYRDTKPFSWHFNSPQGALCLTPAEMTFWTGNATTGTWSAITTIKNAYCPTKTFLNCTITYWLTGVSFFVPPPPSVGSGQINWHRPTFTYGRIVTQGQGG